MLVIFSRFFALPLYLQTIIAMVVGVIVGLVFGTKIVSLAVIAHIIINLIKALATPLLFVTVFDSVLDAQFKGEGVKRLFAVATLNAIMAMMIALLLINVFSPGLWLTDIVTAVVQSSGASSTIKSVTWSEAFKALIPDSVFQPFVNNQIPAIILLAILFGVGIRSLPKVTREFSVQVDGRDVVLSPQVVVEKLRLTNAVLLALLMYIFKFVLYFIPLSVFAAVASAVGHQGLGVFKGLAVYVLICCGGMLLHVLIVYQAWIKLYAGRSLRQFWSLVKTPVFYAFGVNSSLATLPMTLKTMDELRVTPGAARLSACVGTNFNNDGILLYQVAAVLMLAQALGIDMSISQQINLALLSLLATLGVAGIPEAGVIALTIVMTTAKLPVEVIPLLLSVDWVVARLRSVTNVLGDITVGIAIDGRTR